jgi:hypothetical protein
VGPIHSAFLGGGMAEWQQTSEINL